MVGVVVFIVKQPPLSMKIYLLRLVINVPANFWADVRTLWTLLEPVLLVLGTKCTRNSKQGSKSGVSDCHGRLSIWMDTLMFHTADLEHVGPVF